MDAAHRLLTNKYPREESVQLPEKLHQYLVSGKSMSEELYGLLAYWISNLERGLYKNSKLYRSNEYDRRADRIILFIQFAQENKHRDAAYLMSAWRHLFPYAEIVLQTRMRKIALPEYPTLTKLLQSSEVKFIRVYMTICSRLQQIGEEVTDENVIKSWKEYKTTKDGKVPGVIATENFKRRIDYYHQLRDNITILEHGWISRSGLDSMDT